ncbi:hypothetical protein COT99_03885 [Candidatus Falkowbacteria bacterium CG10_big_fil_rev_8_21_14_0_10_43_10]|uniref:Aspartate/ornithine carbamoyltransferase carbamoyl-P binding domain-containing protein n=1 Tax=Candidatus Falkowbacteria bacterium CG10_big_fil_rev_8_21_14_0_10_43_10 TaxID=1974567 RepID=A0A2H0V1D0_9BACT|nr:MAG: hypothetical protein AUJ72_01345 [Candidatus Omnitrophica bacterium CG1_02_46_14]PIR92877.1 MAG: hypothetical protein COT99_03885 [Candidatus Falkowbacteria bacterium CG10_big_fil_rev_8_21_14_0_10_43_10]
MISPVTSNPGLNGKVVRDVTCVNDLSADYISKISQIAQQIYWEMRSGDPQKYRKILTGATCALLFSQESTRTYSSFHNALSCLGARSIEGFRSAQESSVNKGESIFHTIDTFIGQGMGTKFIVIRDGLEGSPRWAQICAFRSYAKKVREFARVHHQTPANLILPIIFNGGDGSHGHPSQLLLDCATFQHEFGRVTDLNFGECNDLGGSRVFSSHLDAAPVLGWKMHICPFEGASLNSRQILGVLRNGTSVKSFSDLKKMLALLDLLYVSRYQFNLRGEKTGEHASSIFSEEHPQISRSLVESHGLKVFHARPIDANAKEISDNLNDHPLDCSGIQSDFGQPTRMAMCIYAINKGLFSLGGIIKSIMPESIGFIRTNLNGQAKKIDGGRYTTAFLENGFVIDHIPIGCGVAIVALIAERSPGIQLNLSMNVRGDGDDSRPKDVIKMYTPSDFEWTGGLDNLLALFTDPTSPKSCRVSRFQGGHRTEKWCWRIPEDTRGDSCVNLKCVTNDKKQGIICHHKEEMIAGKTIRICPMCEWPQEPLALPVV